jgi:hypothetical protein
VQLGAHALSNLDAEALNQQKKRKILMLVSHARYIFGALLNLNADMKFA